MKKGITVESNDPTNPKIKLTIEGEIVVDVEVTPRSVTFKELGKGETAVQNFTIKVTEPDKVKITSVKIEDEKFELALKSGDPAGNSEYALKFKGSKELDRISSRVTVSFEGSEIKFVEVPVRANVVGNLRYSKDIFFFKRGDVYEPKEITISSRTNKPFKILGVSDPDNKLKTKIVQKEGQNAKILAEVADPSANYDNPEKHNLIIKTTDSDDPEVKINYSISSRPRPERGRMGPHGTGNSLVKPSDMGLIKAEPANATEKNPD